MFQTHYILFNYTLLLCAKKLYSIYIDSEIQTYLSVGVHAVTTSRVVRITHNPVLARRTPTGNSNHSRKGLIWVGVLEVMQFYLKIPAVSNLEDSDGFLQPIRHLVPI